MPVVPFPAADSGLDDADQFQYPTSADSGTDHGGPLVRPLPTNLAYDDLLNDVTRARLFAKHYAGRAFYRPDSRTWYLWDEGRGIWLDEREPAHMGRFDCLAQEYLAQLSEYADRQDLPLRAGPESLLSQRCWSALVRLSRHQPEFRLGDRQFDADPRYLGVANGILDLHTCKLVKPNPDLLITSRLPIPYDPNAESALWERVLIECTGTDEDAKDYRLFLREHFGAMLSGDNVRERFTIIYGPGGSGKSTFVNTIKAVLGNNALTTNHDTFSRQRAGAIREDLAAFAGKRLVVDMELPDGHRLDPSVIKMLSGRDQIRARQLYKGGSELHPTWSIVVGCNQLPVFDPPPDSGFWRRVLVLPFEIVPPRPDFTLKTKLAHPKTQTAILTWLVEGLRAHHRRLKHPNAFIRLPKAVQVACAYYRIATDHLGYWYEACVEPARSGESDPTSNQIWESYRQFCDEYNIPFGERTNAVHLGRFLSSQGVTATRRGKSRSRVHLGIRLVDPKRVSLASFEDEYEYKVNLADFHV